VQVATTSEDTLEPYELESSRAEDATRAVAGEECFLERPGLKVTLAPAARDYRSCAQ